MMSKIYESLKLTDHAIEYIDSLKKNKKNNFVFILNIYYVS